MADVVALSLYYMSVYYNNEIIRGFCDKGIFKLKPEYSIFKMNEDDIVLRSGRTPAEISEFINEKIIAQSASSEAQSASSTETPPPHSASFNSASPILASSNLSSPNSASPNSVSSYSNSPHSASSHSIQSDLSFESSHKNTEPIQSSFPITINEQFYDHGYDIPLGLDSLTNISELINERLQPEISSPMAFEGYNSLEINSAKFNFRKKANIAQQLF